MGNSVVQVDGAKLSKFREIKEIMEQPSMKAVLISAVDEAVNCKSKIQFEQQNIKVIREKACEELGIKPALFNAYVAMRHANDYVERKNKYEELIDMIDYDMEEQSLLPGPRADD